MQTEVQEKEQQEETRTKDEKMTRFERILTTIIIVLIAAIGCIPGVIYSYNSVQKVRFAKEPYFTEYRLSEKQVTVLCNHYYIKTEPEWWEVRDMDQWPDYSNYTMEPTEHTQLVVDVLNYEFFIDPDRMEYAYDSYQREAAVSFGFSRENPITVDWVMTHPADAVTLLNEYYELDDYEVLKAKHHRMNHVSEEENTSAKDFLEEQFKKDETE